MLKRLAAVSLCLVVGFAGGVVGSRQLRSIYDDTATTVVCVPQVGSNSDADFRLGDSGCYPGEISVCIEQRSALLEVDAIRVSDCR